MKMQGAPIRSLCDQFQKTCKLFPAGGLHVDLDKFVETFKDIAGIAGLIQLKKLSTPSQHVRAGQLSSVLTWMTKNISSGT